MRLLIPFLVATSALATPAFGNDAEQAEIIVTGQVDGYRTESTTSGTKTETPILDVPQSISVITAEQLRDTNIRSITDLVRQIPGISAGQGEGHRDQITLRGNNSTADFFVDGLRDDVQYFRSFYNIDRVEAHKGPNAMVFGRGGGGGIINRVTKSALVDRNLGAASASVDSFGSWAVEGDTNLLIGPGAVRLNGFYEELNNHRDNYSGERFGLSPVLGAALGAAIKVQLGYEYVEDNRSVDRGIPSQNGRPVKGLRDQFIGDAAINRANFAAHIVRFKGVAMLTPELSLSTTAVYGDYSKQYTNIFAATPLSTTNTLGVEAYRDPTERQNFVGQANLEWRSVTGGIDHVLLIGGEYTDQDTANERINGFFTLPSASAANRRATVALSPQIIIPAVQFIAGAAENSNRAVSSRVSQTSFYMQDQIGLGNSVDLILGVRHDQFKAAVTNIFTGTRATRTDNLWSPRAGLVFKPVPQASVYISYAKSFLPQAGDQFLTLDATSATLKPESFDNYEVGAKWDIRPDLSLSVAVYRLDRSDTRSTGPSNTVIQSGAQRSSGMEFGLTGKVTKHWQTSIGYARTRAVITSATTAAAAGLTVPQVPRHQVSLWNRYDFSDRFGLGLGFYHQSKSFATISNAVTLPAYSRVDAAMFLKLTEQLDAQLNVENITNARYFPFAHNDNNISTGAPTNARLTIRAKF